ncbi:SLAP domain-containing protein [Gracilibacillus sp. YIM 98692]|uniref:SLAP domain-containing protein n=1 Tax=Gracilibacillus sp. YIM 98692 TaxID=2663532 RepID=UPI0013D85CDB|nr:SLAP domain-containing protein [Gracilibacillus sp. YIM 98692]
MQRLVFEKKWEYTISANDKLQIQQLFKKTSSNPEQKSIDMYPIRFALNHRRDLLATMLIHNFTDQSINLSNMEISICYDKFEIAHHSFQEGRLRLQANTSMPWTFIFPEGSYDDFPSQTDSIAIKIR